MISVAVKNSFKLLDADSKDCSNLETFKEMGRVCSNVLLFLTTGNTGQSVKLGNLSR